MGVNTGTNRSRGGLLVQDNNTTTPEDTVFAYGVREIIVTTGTLTNNGQGTVTITTGGGSGGSGTVTSVTLDADSTGLQISSGTSQTITTSGTFTLGGTLVAGNGGTGMNTYNKGDLIVGGTINPLETLGTGGRTAGDFLTIKAGLVELEWSSVLPVANGGTGLTSYSKGDIIYADTGGILFELAIGNTGDVLTVSATGIPEWAPASGSGSGTVNSGTLGEIAYYAATGTAVSGNSGLTFTEAAGVQTFKVSGSEVRTQIEDTTAAVGSRAVITLDPSVPDGTGGVAMFWGTDTTNDQYMKIGAYSGGNNFETKSRDFRIFGATGNLMLMDESAQTSGFGNYYSFTALPTYQLEGGVTNATTNTTISPVAARRGCTGNPAVGIGAGYDFVVQTSNTPSFALGSQIQSKWASGTTSNENFDLYFNTMQGGSTPPATRMIIKGDTGDIYVGKAAFIGGSLSGGVGFTVENGNSMLVSGIAGGAGIAVTNGSIDASGGNINAPNDTINAGKGMSIAAGDLTWGGGSLKQNDPGAYGGSFNDQEFVTRICGTLTTPSAIPDGSALDEVTLLGATWTLEGGNYTMGSAGGVTGYDGTYAGATSTFVSYGTSVTVNLTDSSIFDTVVCGGSVSTVGFTIAELEPFTMQVIGKTAVGNLTIQVFGNAVPL